jgi:heme/copper-type cytochrome/quinol oxidase subunit 2
MAAIDGYPFQAVVAVVVVIVIVVAIITVVHVITSRRVKRYKKTPSPVGTRPLLAVPP